MTLRKKINHMDKSAFISTFPIVYIFYNELEFD